MKNTVTVALGDRKITVPQLTIGQLERVADWLEEASGLDRTMKAALSHNRKLLVIGFERSDPKVTADELAEMEATVGDVAAAVTAILRVAGLAEETISPEAVAPEGASPSSLTSSSASLEPAAGTLPN